MRGVKTGGIILALLLALAVPAEAQHIGAQVPQSAATPGANTLVQAGTLLNAAPTVSAAGTAATITLTGGAGLRVCIRGLVMYDGVVGTNAITVTIQDGATVKLDLGNFLAAGATVGAPASLYGTPLFCGSTGNNVVINVGAGAATQVTHTSVIADSY